MNFRSKNAIAGFLIILTFFIISCKKQNTSIDYNPSVSASKEFAANQQMMTQLLNTYFKSLNDSILWINGYTIVDGALVSIKDSPVYMMEIFYPVWGNNDGYGHYRMGSIDAIPISDFTQPDVLVNFNFNNFLYDKDTLTVNKMSVQHSSGEIENIKKYEIKIDSAIIIYSDSSGQYSFNMSQTFRLKKDSESIYTSVLDEIFITGLMEGITLNLSTYAALIADSSEIMDRFDCPWLKNGPTQMQVTGFAFPALIYFPVPDSCENEYVIEIDGNPFPFPFD